MEAPPHQDQSFGLAHQLLSSRTTRARAVIAE
jgi:hypothetical protein